MICRASLAEFERELIRDRVRAELARVKATGRTRSGRRVGRPRRQVDHAAVQRLRAEGRSWREVAMALHVPRRTPSAFASKVQPGLAWSDLVGCMSCQ